MKQLATCWQQLLDTGKCSDKECHVVARQGWGDSPDTFTGSEGGGKIMELVGNNRIPINFIKILCMQSPWQLPRRKELLATVKPL